MDQENVNLSSQSNDKTDAARPPGGQSPGALTEAQSPQMEEKSRKLSASPAAYASTAVPAGTQDSGSGEGTQPPDPPGYGLVRRLGQGTYGEVWLAEEETTGVQVAIKFLTTTMSQQWQLMQAEVKQLAMLRDDPGIVQLKDFDSEAERPYYVMAYAEGGSLGDKLREGPMAVADALPLFRRIAEALAYVHAKGIRHCDLKPGNILLDKLGHPRIADFGQAHLISDLSPALGTFFYMAPEQADLTAGVADTRWDVYGLGALFYAMVTGKPPHDDSTLKAELAQTEQLPHRLRIYRETMQRAKLPKHHREVDGMDTELANIVERCLAPDANKRFRTAEAVVVALDRRLRSIRQKPILIAGLVVPMLLLLILGALGFWEARDALRQSEQALVGQAKKSYIACARLAAGQVQRKMNFYIQELTDFAQSEELKTVLENPRTPENRKKIQGLLAKFNSSIPGTQKPVKISSLFDEKGFLLGMYPPERELLDGDHNFAWRSYFYGGEDDWDAKKEADKVPGTIPKRNGRAFKPIDSAHISHPYKSYDSNTSPFVGLSTPVKGKEGFTIGVLVANLDLDELNRWLQETVIDDGSSVLIDNQCHIIKHDNKEGRLPDYETNPKKYKGCDLYNEVFLAHPKIGNAGYYEDPLDPRSPKEKYLASYVPIDFSITIDRNERKLEQRWGVLVQIKYDKLIEPTRALRNEMVRWGAIMLTVALLLILGLWLGMYWLLRYEERRAYG